MKTQASSFIKSNLQSFWLQIFLALAVIFTFQLMAAAPVQAGVVECVDDKGCDNGVFCDGFEKCLNGFCEPGLPIKCPAPDDCTEYMCNEDIQDCEKIPKDGNQCDDKNPCTSGDICADGSCVGTPVHQGAPCDGMEGPVCEGFRELCILVDRKIQCIGIDLATFCPTLDNDPTDCETLECVEDDGSGFPNCLPTSLTGGEKCDDGQFCTLNDICDENGKCGGKEGLPEECNDKMACTDDSCDEDNDACVHDPIPDCCAEDADCDDHLACNGKETCSEGMCLKGRPFLCEFDPNPCIESQGCVEIGTEQEPEAFCQTTYKAVDSPCEGDEDLCTEGTCQLVEDPGPAPVEAFIILPPKENPPTECVEDPKDCTGEDPRTCVEDFCDQETGQCVHDTEGCECPEMTDCDDGNPCTANECDQETGLCLGPEPLPGMTCDDGDACTEGDVCNADGMCTSGSAKDCSDGNECTTDACDSNSGQCRHTLIPGCPPSVPEDTGGGQEILTDLQAQGSGLGGCSLHSGAGSFSALAYLGWLLVGSGLFLKRKRMK